MPETIFKDITPRIENNKEYEFKTDNLRVYLFHEKNTRHIIGCGGKKGSQKADIGHFKKMKKFVELYIPIVNPSEVLKQLFIKQ